MTHMNNSPDPRAEAIVGRAVDVTVASRAPNSPVKHNAAKVSQKATDFGFGSIFAGLLSIISCGVIVERVSEVRSESSMIAVCPV